MDTKKNAALLVMAAGMGSRYGGIKQLDSFGPDGEIIMDYSIFDAVKSGFTKIVIVIRRDIEDEFMWVYGNRLISKCPVPVKFTYQDINDLPDGAKVPNGRTKPWGTGQAVLSAAPFINEPFVVINSDDFYGRAPYEHLFNYLTTAHEDNGKEHFCMAGYRLNNTLSDNGSVSRGICSTDSEDFLTSIEETFKIAKKDGVISGEKLSGENVTLVGDAITSMNMMGFTPSIFKELQLEFKNFTNGLSTESASKAEFMLPVVVSNMIKAGQADMKVLPNDERWYGVTYKEDKPVVRAAFQRLTDEGVYKKELWS